MERSLGSDFTWQRCAAGVRATLLVALRARAPQMFAGATITDARHSRVPFYDDHALYDIDLEGVAGVERALLLRSERDMHWLDGTSAPIHAVNEQEVLQLTAQTVPAYVRFFLFVLRGGQGAFTLIESADELAVAESVDDPTAALAVLNDAKSQWQPLQLHGNDDSGRFRVTATVAYAGGLYRAGYAVKPNGEIVMIDDSPLVIL